MDAVEILTAKELANWTPPPKKEEKNEPKVLRLPKPCDHQNHLPFEIFKLSWDEWLMNAEVEDMEDSIEKVAELLRKGKI